MTQPGAAPAPPPGPGGPGPAPEPGGASAPGEVPAGAQPEAPQDTGLGSGDAAAEAISRPGQSTLRNEYLREAERLTVEGDAVGRDKNIFLVGGKQLARLRLLPGRQVEPIREAFVEPGGLKDIRTAFEKKKGTVILRGPAGYGKQGLAIHMLIDVSPGAMFHLDRAVDLTRLAEWIETDLAGRNRIEEGAGFLLNQPLGFANLYGSVLQGLDEALERAKARLVLTIDSDVPVPDRDLLDYIVEVTSAPDYFGIVASRLRFRLTRELADHLMARAEVREVITRQLADGASCKLAADLAEAIAAEWDISDDEHEFDIKKIESWKSERGAEDFDIWFAELGDTRTRSFAIALGVLNGLPYDAVAMGARALYRAFDKPPYLLTPAGDDIPPDPLRPFRTSRREWLHKLQARTKETTIQGPYGPSRAEAVEYRDPGYAVKVIRRAWSDFEAQDVLLAWLGALADDPAEQVRIAAGMALGRLAASSFDTFCSSVLESWAAGPDRGRREAVAYALRVVIADPGLRETVTQLIFAWYASHRPFAQATAARAYGVAYGAVDARVAFEALDRLTVVDDIRVATAIGDSVADLIAAGDDDFAGYVLPRLADSARQRDRTGAVQLVFLILADGLVARTAGSVSWPLLLHLTTRLPQVRPAIVTLWRCVLNEALFHDEAEQVMTRWAAVAEGDPAVREAFLRLARAIARDDERSLMILDRYCTLWVSADNLSPLPAISSALQTVLTTDREAR